MIEVVVSERSGGTIKKFSETFRIPGLCLQILNGSDKSKFKQVNDSNYQIPANLSDSFIQTKSNIAQRTKHLWEISAIYILTAGNKLKLATLPSAVDLNNLRFSRY